MNHSNSHTEKPDFSKSQHNTYLYILCNRYRVERCVYSHVLRTAVCYTFANLLRLTSPGSDDSVSANDDAGKRVEF